jgi:sec-independent protein translocase protein TatA
MGMGPTELVVILVILLVLFGGAKLPSLARGLGQSIKEFKKASKEDAASDPYPPAPWFLRRRANRQRPEPHEGRGDKRFARTASRGRFAARLFDAASEVINSCIQAASRRIMAAGFSPSRKNRFPALQV